MAWFYAIITFQNKRSIRNNISHDCDHLMVEEEKHSESLNVQGFPRFWDNRSGCGQSQLCWCWDGARWSNSPLPPINWPEPGCPGGSEGTPPHTHTHTHTPLHLLCSSQPLYLIGLWGSGLNVSAEGYQVDNRVFMEEVLSEQPWGAFFRNAEDTCVLEVAPSVRGKQSTPGYTSTDFVSD